MLKVQFVAFLFRLKVDRNEKEFFIKAQINYLPPFKYVMFWNHVSESLR